MTGPKLTSKEFNLVVPDDVLVVGNDIQELACYTHPSPLTLVLPNYQWAAMRLGFLLMPLSLPGKSVEPFTLRRVLDYIQTMKGITNGQR